MLNHYQRLARNVRPIKISHEDALSGPRVGGNAPAGVVPPKVSPLTQYLLTVRVDESHLQEVSVFTDLDDEANSIYRNVSKLYSTEGLVQVVIHPGSKRANTSYLASPLSGRALELGVEIPDNCVEPGGELLLPSKLGGRPYFFYYATSYIEAVNRLFSEGFVLFLQMTWPGPKLSPPGPWPFDEYTFHLFAKETSDGIAWRYGWG